MTQSFKNMLYLFGSYANGTETNLQNKINMEELRTYAIQQGIWTIVFPALNKIIDAGQYKQEVFIAVSQAMLKKEFTLAALKKLEESGIKCCLLKGTVVAELYNNPDYRISSDTDILIDPKDEDKVKNLLIDLGYKVDKRNSNDHHLKAYHNQGGLLEVHVKLYSYITENIIFNQMDLYNEPWRVIKLNNDNFHTLGINDGLMYLTAHYIKHLINEGGGVRQMMDLLLYMKKYESEIDFKRYNKILKELKYYKLIDTVKSIGAKYWGMDFKLVDQRLMEDLLNDTEKGGIFGYATDERKGFYNDYCAKRSNLSRRHFNLLSDIKSESSMLKRLFPSKTGLINFGYSYARLSILVPVAWLHRLIKSSYKKFVLPDDTSENDNSKRMNLMRRLGMID